MSEDFEILYSDSKESGSHHSHHILMENITVRITTLMNHATVHIIMVHIDTVSSASAENAYL